MASCIAVHCSFSILELLVDMLEVVPPPGARFFVGGGWPGNERQQAPVTE